MVSKIVNTLGTSLNVQSILISRCFLGRCKSGGDSWCWIQFSKKYWGQCGRYWREWINGWCIIAVPQHPTSLLLLCRVWALCHKLYVMDEEIVDTNLGHHIGRLSTTSSSTNSLVWGIFIIQLSIWTSNKQPKHCPTEKIWSQKRIPHTDLVVELLVRLFKFEDRFRQRKKKGYELTKKF